MNVQSSLLDVVCHLQCPVCKHKAVGVTEASAQRQLDAYHAHLDNLPLAERAECIVRFCGTMYQFKFCRHCAELSENFLPATIRYKRTLAKAQRVLAPAIPFAWSDELRFSPQEE